jgi:hypothetical protein
MIPAPATSRSRSNRVNDALSPYEYKTFTKMTGGDNILRFLYSLRIKLFSLLRRASTPVMRAYNSCSAANAMRARRGLSREFHPHRGIFLAGRAGMNQIPRSNSPPGRESKLRQWSLRPKVKESRCNDEAPSATVAGRPSWLSARASAGRSRAAVDSPAAAKDQRRHVLINNDTFLVVSGRQPCYKQYR